MAQTKRNNVRKRNNRTLRGGAAMGYEKKDFTKELEILVNTCEGEEPHHKEARQKLMQDNLIFTALVFAAIGSKNKLDFPPAGPRSDDKIAYQDKRIRLILQAISEYDKDAQGTSPLENTLGKWGVVQQAIMNTRTLASKGKRTVDAVKTTSTSSVKNYPGEESEPLLSTTSPLSTDDISLSTTEPLPSPPAKTTKKGSWW
jgi:hypothetical protein